MITYLDRALVMYPGIQHVVYWYTQQDMTPWENPYDGLVWNNTEIPKPTQAMLDTITDEQVLEQKQENRIIARDQMFKQDLNIVANFMSHLQNHPGTSFSEYLDYLEQVQQTL